MTQVFLSHSTLDVEFVDQLAGDLRAAGIVVWKAPDSILPGEEWVDAIQRGLTTSSHLLLVKSPNAVNSKWVRFEFNRALARFQNDRMMIIPIHYESCDAPDFWLGFQHVNLQDDYADGLKELIHRLITERPDNAPMPTPPATTTTNMHISGSVNAPTDVAGHNVLQSGADVGRPDLPTQTEAAEASQATISDNLGMQLNKSEIDIIHYVALGWSNNDIAVDKSTTPRDIAIQISNIYRKLEVSDRISAIGRATELKLLSHRLDIPVPSFSYPPKLSTLLPPPFAWCEIPSGRVVLDDYMGILPVQPFYMAKYPITYAQYQMFLNAPDGFLDNQWWEGLDADSKHRSAAGDQRWKINNHPRENVSWWDAVAFTRWLSKRTSTIIRLPTEWEWEYAAEGPKANRFPWGNDLFNYNRGNFAESGKGQTMPVDFYLEGRSVFDVVDMSGNVWEWCLNEYDKPINVGLNGSKYRAVRGGSWKDDYERAYTYYRSTYSPSRRLNVIGFRIACFPPAP